MTDSRSDFEAWAVAKGYAYRDMNGFWFYPGRGNGHTLFVGWEAGRATNAIARAADVETLMRLADALAEAYHFSHMTNSDWHDEKEMATREALRAALAAMPEKGE